MKRKSNIFPLIVEKDNIRSIKREFNVKAISTEINVIRSKC